MTANMGVTYVHSSTIQEHRVPSPNTLKFSNLWLRSWGRSVAILRFERQWPATGWLNLKQTAFPLILKCVFLYLLMLLCVSFDLSQDCLSLWIAQQCIEPTTSCKPEKMKVSLIVLFSHSSPSFSVTGIFLTGKGNVSFHLNVKQIEIHFSMSKFQGLQYLWQERKQLDRWSISVKLKS